MTLNQKRSVQRVVNGKMKTKLEWVKKRCGKAISYEVAFKTFNHAKWTKGNSRFAIALLYRVAVLQGLQNTCADKLGKQAVKASVHEVVCTHDANATGKKLKREGPILELDKKKKVLRAAFTQTTANISFAVSKWLGKNL